MSQNVTNTSHFRLNRVPSNLLVSHHSPSFSLLKIAVWGSIFTTPWVSLGRFPLTTQVFGVHERPAASGSGGSAQSTPGFEEQIHQMARPQRFIRQEGGGRGTQNVWPGDQTVWRCLPKSRCVRPAICQISAVQVKHWKGQRTLFFRAIIVPGLRSHEFLPRDICVI